MTEINLPYYLAYLTLLTILIHSIYRFQHPILHQIGRCIQNANYFLLGFDNWNPVLLIRKCILNVKETTLLEIYITASNPLCDLASALYSHCILIASALHSHCIRIASALHPHCICIASALHPHCIRIASTLHPHCMHIVSALHPCYIWFASALYSHCTYCIHTGWGN